MIGSPRSVSAHWHQRGYNDAIAGRDSRPPDDDAAAAAYRVGYRRGATKLRQQADDD